MRTLGFVVASVELGAEGGLQLKFSNGDQITFPKPVGYEGYRMSIGEEEFFGNA